MLNFEEFRKAASKSALKARRKAHELLPQHVAAAYKEAEKIAAQRANAEALHTYLGDVLWQIAELVKASYDGRGLLVKTHAQPGDKQFRVTIEDPSRPQRGVLSLGIDSVPFSENGTEPYQTLAITMRHPESSRSEYRNLLYIKEGMRTLSGPDQRELCRVVNARIEILLSQGQKPVSGGGDLRHG
ncbi:hypothetical protein [Methyloferula stellata]|uniref:hypothetical protein n=1 Tax=Methyloferula stellata TaxID=876270 RepID=UPI000368026D|nr:hypothetical protein [Methyloferula stellata]